MLFLISGRVTIGYMSCLSASSLVPAAKSFCACARELVDVGDSPSWPGYPDIAYLPDLADLQHLSKLMLRRQVADGVHGRRLGPTTRSPTRFFGWRFCILYGVRHLISYSRTLSQLFLNERGSIFGSMNILDGAAKLPYIFPPNPHFFERPLASYRIRMSSR